MRKILICSLIATGITIPMLDSKISAQATRVTNVDCVEFKNYRNEMIEKVQAYEKYKTEEQKRIELEQERLKQEELERIRVKEQRQKLINKLGYEPSKVKEVTCKITFYYADNNLLQGGYNDKKGVPLHSHNEPIVALPSDVPYGTYIEFDEAIRGNTLFKNVDSGNAIKWLSDDTLVVDVFVPEANSYEWLINNVENTTVTGRIYYK